MSNPDGPHTGRPPVRSENGMIATSHYLASATGLKTLRNGGSAADAAIAANAVLCVVYPHMAGLGGDGFWLVHGPSTKGVEALNASGPAAQNASIDYYKEKGYEDEIPNRGALAALTVPGAVDGWRQVHLRFGKLPWKELFQDAIDYAKNGIPVSRSVANWISKDIPVFEDNPSSARIFMPQGRVFSEGERIVNKELAQTLETLAKKGARKGFYENDLPERICNDISKKGSPLQPEDFKNYKAKWVDPISTSYRGYDVIGFPPNTQGFAALQILNIIEEYDLTGWGDESVDYYHHMAEAVKLAFADRDAWLSDPDFIDIPIEELLSKSYARDRRQKILADQAMDMQSVKPGIPAPSRVMESHGGDTCYFCATDSDGLTISAIQSIFHDFGSAVVGGDSGVVMQNRGSAFSLDDEHPNCLEPGKRPFHTLIPAMLMRNDEPYLAFGTMGGEGQPQTQAALVTRLIDFEYDVQQAIEAPRWLMGRTWGTKSQDLSLEGRISDEVVRDLKLRGQPIKMLPDWNDNMGHAQAIRIHTKDGFFEGGADPRGDGFALGY